MSPLTNDDVTIVYANFKKAILLAWFIIFLTFIFVITSSYIDSEHAIAHNKIIVVDRNVLITGSFNFTQAAEKNNAENLLIMKGNKPLVDAYIRNFGEHKSHSEAYVGRMNR